MAVITERQCSRAVVVVTVVDVAHGAAESGVVSPAAAAAAVYISVKISQQKQYFKRGATTYFGVCERECVKRVVSNGEHTGVPTNNDGSE